MLDSDAFVGTWDFKKKEVGIYKTISRARNRISDLQVQATFLTLSGLFEPMVTPTVGHCLLLGLTCCSTSYRTSLSNITLQSYSHYKTVCPTTYYVFIHHHIGCGASPSKAVARRSSSTIVYSLPYHFFL